MARNKRDMANKIFKKKIDYSEKAGLVTGSLKSQIRSHLSNKLE